MHYYRQALLLVTLGFKPFAFLWNKLRLGDGFGRSSEFGFRNSSQIFGLLPPNPQTDPNQDWHTLGFGYPPYSARKTRYISSTYCPGSALSQLLIIGRSKAGGRCRSSPSGPSIYESILQPYGIGNDIGWGAPGRKRCRLQVFIPGKGGRPSTDSTNSRQITWQYHLYNTCAQATHTTQNFGLVALAPLVQ